MKKLSHKKTLMQQNRAQIKSLYYPIPNHINITFLYEIKSIKEQFS